ncbi:rhomboid family intramembrane serine protease [Rhizobium sp. 2YAF20]|uniref:rhomboid family intramembrane serine protease n=1 Tax=Rhizobium sp. 2YAF20 TaxID=3233027 RepID=UPI003F9BC851
MKSEEQGNTVYWYDKSKLLRNFLILVVIVVGALWAIFTPDKAGNNHQVLWWICAVFFGSLALATLHKLLSNAPALVISPAGVLLPNFASEMVPWLAIRNLQRIQNKRFEYIAIRVDPTVAKSLRKSRVREYLQMALQGSQSKATIPLNLMQGDPDTIFRRCTDALTTAREAQRIALAESGLPPSLADDPTEAPASKSGKPLFTYTLIALLAAIYFGELTFGVHAANSGTPSIQTLFILGGTLRQAVVDGGQWWRLFTAPLMHGSIPHLAFNCFALWLAGSMLERLIGWRWFAGIFFVSALGGSLASVFLNAPNIVGVGASGGIVGLFAAALAASFHFQSSRIAYALRIRAVQIVVPSLLPFLSTVRNGENIDYAAHLGGAIAGVILALAMLGLWPRQRPYPRFSKSMAAISAVFLAVAAGSLLPISELREATIAADPMDSYSAGLYEQAAKGFAAKAQAGDENVSYYFLWQFLAETHLTNTQAVAGLRANAAKVDQTKWPYPVYGLFLGELTPEDVLVRAAGSDQRCEATFYTGEWHLWRKDNQKAVPEFRNTLSSCPKTFMEYEGATAELKHLGAQ